MRAANQSGPIPRRNPWWIYVVLFVATFAVYGQVRQFEFVNYDDPEYVTSNTHVRQGLTSEGVRWAFQSVEAANWFPVTRLSHLLDGQVFRLDSGMHHLTNVLIHALATLLLFAFLERATRALWGSAFVAFVFALHPLHVESVAWVAERKDVLNALLWFLALWTYVLYVERRSWRRYLLVLGAFCLGLLSKPAIITLPFVLLLIDFWPLRRFEKERASRIVREKIIFFVLAAAAAAVTYTVQQGSRAVKTLNVFPLALRVENALVSYAAYIEKTFWPSGLAVFYPYPAKIALWRVVIAGGLIAGLSIVFVRLWRTRPYLAVGWFWFLGTLIPMIGLVQIGAQARADRYMYVPMVGLLIVVAWGSIDVIARWPRARGTVTAVAFVACASCVALTTVQLGYWRDSESLFAHALAVTTGNYVAEHNLGLAIAGNPARLPEAIEHYRAALAIRPDSVEAHSDLGSALANTGQLPAAATEYEAALRLAPDAAIPHNNLGNVFFQMKLLEQAIREYEAALRIRPDYAEAHNDLGAAFATSGRMDAAIEQFQAALRIEPDYAQARTNLELALKQEPR